MSLIFLIENQTHFYFIRSVGGLPISPHSLLGFRSGASNPFPVHGHRATGAPLEFMDGMALDDLTAFLAADPIVNNRVHLPSSLFDHERSTSTSQWPLRFPLARRR